MKKIYLKFLMTFFCFSFLLISSGFGQATHRVGSIGQDFTTIQEAINSSSVTNGDTIFVVDAVHTESGILLSKNLVIKGQGKNKTIIQAAESITLSENRVFDIPVSASVVIEDLAVMHGNVSSYGGGIKNQGTLLINNCLVTDNNASPSSIYEEGGGGIYNSGILTVKFSEISNNRTSGSGAGIWMKGADSELYIENCIIKDNETVVSGAGFGVYEGSKVEIKNSLIVNNNAEQIGGGIYVDADFYGSFTLNSVTIYGNTSKDLGGGIHMFEGEFFIINSIIAGNSNIYNPDFSDITLWTSGYSLGYNIIGIGGLGFVGTETDKIGNMDTPLDPVLNSEFYPEISSPCLNMGPENIDVLNIENTDAYGNPRLYGEGIDVGAVELQKDALPTYLISISESAIDFGKFPIDTTKRYKLKVNNEGNENLTLDSIFVPGEFKVRMEGEELWNTSIYNVIITSKASRNIEISLTSNTDSIYMGDLIIYSDADNLPEISIPMEATVTGRDYVIGDIFENTTWCSDTVNIGGNVTVTENTILSICPGTVVNFLGDYYLEINGQLLSNGLEGDTIIFTTNTAEWGGIRFANINMAGGEASYIRHTKIEKGEANTSSRYERGGGINLDNSATLFIFNSVISNNGAKNTGGGIHNEGILEIINSSIKDNTTHEWNGLGGAGISNYGSVKIISSKVSNNSCNGYTGGGIATNGTLHLENSIIEGNYSYRSGGGVYINGGVSNITNCLIVNNTAHRNYGCGINASDGTVNIINSTIYGNHTTYDSDGGGLYSYRATVNLLNTIIAGNTAQYYDNVYCEYEPVNSLGYNLIGTDDGFTFPAVKGDITGTNSNPVNPFLNSDYSLSDSSSAINSGILDTIGLNIPNIDIFGNSRIYDGDVDRIDIGASEYQGNIPLIPDLKINKNTINFGSADIGKYAYGEVLFKNIGHGDAVIDSILAPNGYYISFTGTENLDTLIENVTIPVGSDRILTVAFKPDLAQTYSGDIIIKSNDLTDPYMNISVFGDVIDLLNLQGEISTDYEFCADTVNIVGNLKILKNATLTICPGTIVNFTGTYWLEINGQLKSNGTITDTILFTGSGWWKGLRFTNIEMNVNEASEIKYTKIENGATNKGGGIYLDHSTELRIDHCEISSNYSSGEGGGIYNEGSLIITNSLIENNSSLEKGGGIYNPGSLNLENSTVRNNHSRGEGGGIHSYGKLLLLNDSIISNSCDYNAGGMYLGGDNVQITNCLIAKNSSKRRYGCGIQVFNGNINISNSTITGNFTTQDAQGGGLYNTFATVNLLNTIIAGNSAHSYDDIYSQIGTINSHGYNLIGNTDGFTFPTVEGDIIGTNSNPIDPYLNADYSLSDSSIAVNNGIADTAGLNIPHTDILGNPRIFAGTGNRIDIGAFELQKDKKFLLNLDVDNTAIDFGYIQIGEQSDKYILTLTNLGNVSENLSISVPYGFKISLNDEDYYSSISDINIGIFESTNLSVIMEPVSIQEYSGTLSIFGSSNFEIPISGNGTNFNPSFSFVATIPVVDGMKDDLWNDITPEILNLGLYGSEHDVETEFRSVWNNDSLYLLVSVKDDSLYSGNPDSTLNDNIELYLDFDNSKGESYDGNDYMIRFVWGNEQFTIENGSVLSGLYFNQKTSNDSKSYNLEIAIPWSSTGIIPVSGTEIGFDMNFIDNDGSGIEDEITWYSYASDKNTSPSKFGTAILLDENGIDHLTPNMVITHEELNFNISCEDSILIPVTISNVHNGRDLIYEESNSLEDILKKLNTNYSSITDLIPNVYNFSDGETGNRIQDGGNNMYDWGNYLNTNFQTKISYSDNTIITSSAFGDNGKYFTKKYDGLFILAADLKNVDYFELTGNNGANGAGSVNGLVINSNVNGIDYTGFVKRVYNTGSPSINHLIITTSPTTAIHSFASNSDNDQHKVDNLNNSKRIYYLLYAGSDGTYIDDIATKQIMNEFLKFLPQGIDSVEAEGSVERNFVVYTQGLPNGITQDSLVITSNDSNNPADVVEYTITKEGYPGIKLAVNTIDFGEVLQNHYSKESLIIENTSCGVLQIDSITSTNHFFFSEARSLEIEPRSSEVITLYFLPETTGEFSEFMVIHSNDMDKTIHVKGVTADTIPPVITATYVNDDRPNILVAEFNEDLRQPENHIGFSVEGTAGTINSFTFINNNILEFELTSNVVFGESLLLNYNDSVTSIMDASKRKNVLENFERIQVVNNVEFIDDVPPIIIKASVENANPRKVILEFDEEVFVTDQSGITINGTSGSITGIDNSEADVLVITLDSNILYGEVLTLNYVTAGGNITDVSKIPNPLQDINGLTIINYVDYVDIFVPKLVSATIENATPTQVDLVFNEAVAIIDETGFTLTGTTGLITGVSGSGTEAISFTLDAAVTFGENLELSYNEAVGNVVDTAETPNNLISFGPETVINNVLYSGGPQTNPTLIGLSVENANAYEIVVVFDENVTLTDQTGFSVSGTAASITGVTGSGNDTLIFTIDVPVVYGDIILFSYNATGDIQDGDTYPLAAFSNYTIVNNVAYADNVAPVINMAIVEDNTPTLIELTFDEDVVFTDATGLTINGTTGSIVKATGSGTDVMSIELDVAVVYGELLTIDYNQLIGNIKDQAAVPNDLATFNGFLVANYVEFIDTTKPLVVSASVENSNPYEVVIGFSEKVSYIDFTGITINGNSGTISAIEGNNSKIIILTMDKPVIYGEILTLDYSVGNITDIASTPNSLDSFSGVTIINNVEKELINPFITKANIADARPDAIEVNLNEAILLTDHTGFTVTGTTGAIIGVSGSETSVLTFTLNADANYGENIVLSYNGQGNIKDRTGNIMMPVDFNVTNNILDRLNPNVVSASIDDNRHNEVIVTFDEIINISGVGGFSFTIDGVSCIPTNVTGSNTNSVLFTLPIEVKYGDVVLMNYDAVAGNVIDLSVLANPLQDISNRSVTNNIIPNSDATLSDLAVNGKTVSDFNTDTLIYYVDLAYGTTTMPAVTAISTDPNATILITDAISLPGSTIITVTAEDGITVVVYSINFTIAPNTDATLSNLLIDGTTVSGFNPGSLVYNIELAYGTVVVPTITATSNDPNADIIITNAASLPGSTIVKVIAEDGVTEVDYIINFTIATNTSDDISRSEINIYPNPSSGMFNIELERDSSDDINIEIFDVVGKIVFNKRFNYSEKIKVDATTVPQGLYLLKVKVNSKTISKQIIIN